VEPGAPTRPSDHSPTHEQANDDQNYKVVVQGHTRHPGEKSRPDLRMDGGEAVGSGDPARPRCRANQEHRAAGVLRPFAHPHSPWERGSNENLNRIVREYFPKGTPISSDPKYLAMVACDINDRPRKIQNWKKPSELLTELVESNASTG
jgi:hypothetical protein